jgi:hypothetical protein
VALSLTVLVAAGALVVDIGYMRLAGTQLQGTLDAAATAGATMLGGDEETAVLEILGTAALNDAAGQSVELDSRDVEWGVWDIETSSFLVTAFGSADAVRVSHTVEDLSTFLGPAIGATPLGVTRSSVAGTGGGAANCVILADSFAKLTGNLDVDGYNSEEGSYLATRNSDVAVCSNDDLACGGSATVDGSIYAGPGDDLGADCDVTEDAGHLPDEVEMPEVDCTEAAADNNNHTVSSFLRGKDFKANAKDSVFFEEGTYYFEKFEVHAKATLELEGPVTVCVSGGSVSINGDALVNPEEDPRWFTLLVDDTSKVTLNGSSEFHGTVLAPYSELVKLNGTMEFFGVLVGEEVQLNGNLDLHGDVSLSQEHIEGSSGGGVRMLW